MATRVRRLLWAWWAWAMAATALALMGREVWAGVSAGMVILARLLERRVKPPRFGLDHDVNTLGYSFRVYHDYGCALADHRAAIRSNGAA